MQIITYIIAFLIAILVLVSLHELGHFIAAKVLGIKVLRFSIGFGKTLWRWQGRETEYVIGILPLGGYVKMLDENEGEVAPAEVHRAFNRQNVLTRAVVVIAGPAMNLLFAIVAFWMVYCIGIEQAKPIIGRVMPNSIAAQAKLQKGEEIIQINHHSVTKWQDVVIAIISRIGDTGTLNIVTKVGNDSEQHTYQLPLYKWRLDPLKPDPLLSLGIKPYAPPIPPIIHSVKPNSPAAKNGLQAGDRIVSYDHTSVSDWMDFVEFTQTHPGQNLQIKIKRNGSLKTITLKIASMFVPPFKRIGYVGIMPEEITWPSEVKQNIKYSLLDAWVPAWQETWDLLRFNYIMIGKLISGKISLQSLGGPIMIMQSANAAFVQGLIIYVSFLGFLSVMLAFVNMLPIPTLDGGHFIYLIIEAITGRPVSLAAQHITMRIGLIILALLIISATVNDVMRML